MSSKNYLDKNGLTYFWGKVQNEISPKANTSDVLTKTNTTSYTPTANYHPATKKYVDDKGFTDLSDVFVITCSVDGSNNHVVDKTWTEITTAINVGKDVYIKCFDYYLYPLTGFEASGSTQGYASFYAPFTWGDGSLENYTVTVWDTTFSGNTHSPWEDNTGTSPVLYFDVSYSNDTYTIGSGVTATDLYNLINSGAIVVLKYSGLYYHLSQYYDMDEITLYFVSDNGWSFEKFTVTDRLGTTTITYTYESQPSIKAGTGDSAVIINDYYDIPCVASGDGALSEGGATKASGTLSHSEGYVTTAQGNYSHAENQLSLAYGVGSHSEGGTLSGNITISGDANATTYTIVSGCPKIYGTAGDTALYVKLYYNSEYNEPVSVTMSDGVISTITLDSTLDENNALTGASAKLFFRNVAKGKGSHAEGGATYAHADYSHAEGKQTHAAGANSHTEGLVTTAASANQHVQGKYNIVDSAGTYAHIVGNGTSSSAQSNAHTLDWNGNGWYAGKLTVGAAPTNTLDVATKGYVDGKELSDLSDIFIIECTTENNESVVDKTWAEITTAYNAGKKIFAKYESSVLPLMTFSQSSSSAQGYVAFYSPYAYFSPSLDPYYGQWVNSENCLVVWDTTWSGQGGEMDAWDTSLLPERVPITTYYEDQNDSNNYCLQRINNDWGTSIFMERYDQNGSSTFNMGSSGINITSTLGVRIQNLVTPTNDTDAATKGYVDSAVSGFSTNLSGLTDTTITSPSGGQVLSYDSTSSKWVNADTPAIKSGTGENSVIAGVVEDDSSATTYTLYLTGAANSRTYSYTTQDTLPTTIKTGSYVEYSNQYTAYTALIESIDTTNHSITLSRTFYDALSNAEVKIYYRYTNVAKGDYSFAEGRWTAAIGSYSHAEGSSTLAGLAAHAEGTRTSATGMSSHSEGQCTSAEGAYSHSEGYYTITSSSYQHVQGKFNIEDDSGTYAHIVGNGTDSNTRSNAHTLDWDGNSWYAGKVSAGTVASPASVTNANDLTTKAYVDNALSGVTTNLAGLTDTTVSSPSNGQILIYNSTTSKWENATSPYQTQAQVNALIAAALAEYGDGDTATYGYTDGNEVNY